MQFSFLVVHCLLCRRDDDLTRPGWVPEDVGANRQARGSRHVEMWAKWLRAQSPRVPG